MIINRKRVSYYRTYHDLEIGEIFSPDGMTTVSNITGNDGILIEPIHTFMKCSFGTGTGIINLSEKHPTLIIVKATDSLYNARVHVYDATLNLIEKVEGGE